MENGYDPVKLKALADFGLSVPDDYEHWDMGNWRNDIGGFSCTYEEASAPLDCGTVACMVGHAVVLGIITKPELVNEGDFRFETAATDQLVDDVATFQFLFSGAWPEIEGHQTARACASRILWLLEDFEAHKAIINQTVKDTHSFTQCYEAWSKLYPILDPVYTWSIDDIKAKVLA